MKYREEKRDLFSVDDSYYIAHCISADFALGTGIAVEFNKRFDMKNILKSKYPNFLHDYITYNYNGMALIEGRVINLITKERYYNKSTYQSLAEALTVAKYRIPSTCKKIAMPLIGCGLDRLQWDRVSAMIKEIFADEDIEILVCKR